MSARLADMPLRRRLVAAVTLVMVVTLAVGLVLTYLHARRKVDVEMTAAMVGGRQIVEREVEELDATPEAARDLPGLVRVFDGHRHITASLVDASGRVLYRSTLDTEDADVPPLLVRALGGQAQVWRREVALGPNERGAVILKTDANSEVGEVSADAALNLTVLLVLFVLVLFSLNAILTRALASFGALAAVFERIGRGDYEARVPETGPPEFARLSKSCNDMADQLGRMDAHARRLGLQLSRVQEEERADLARNLHDEVSPFLFAVDVDAAAIRDRARDLPGEAGAALAARADAIREATAHMKGQVRHLLGRLRPAVAPDLGLAEAIEDLVARARARHPDVAIRAQVTADSVDDETATVLHTIVREALSNALQHGAPKAVEIAVATDGAAVTVRVADDGGGLAPKGAVRGAVGGAAKSAAAVPAAAPHLRGFGVLGMRERVETRGGRFAMRERADGRGVIVEVVLPYPKGVPDDGRALPEPEEPAREPV